MFKVIVVAYYFPPMGLSGVQRTQKFVKYLPDFGWQPTVITTGKTTYFAFDEALLKEVEDKNVEIIRVEGNDPNTIMKKAGARKPPRERLRKILNRISQTIFIPDNKKSWSKKAAKKVDELLSTGSYDLVFVTAPPFSAFAEIAKLKERHNVPIVFDYRDLWYESYFAFYPTPAHKFKHYKTEYAALRKVDRVTVTNRKIKEKLLLDYPFLDNNNVIIVRHGYDEADFENAPKIEKENDKLLITHSGNFIEYTTPEYMLKALRNLQLKFPEIAADLEFHFVGIMDKRYQKLIKKYKLELIVKVYGYMEHSEAVRKVASSDVLWFMIGRKPNIDAILPGKLFEYVGARKPIFGSVPDGAAKLVLEEYGASFISKPDDIEEITQKLVEIYKLYKAGNLPVPDEEYVKSHERKKLTEELTKVFQFLLKEET